MKNLLAGLCLMIGLVSASWAAPEVHMNWQNRPQVIELTVRGYDEVFEQCLQSGLEVRYRYEVKLCDRRKLWFDDCLDVASFTQAVQYDAISQDYRLSLDQRGDEVSPVLSHLSVEEQALQRVARLSDLSLSGLGLDATNQGDLLSSSGVVRVRVLADCKGGYNRTLARLSYFLTLGLLRISGFNTGWVDFSLNAT